MPSHRGLKLFLSVLGFPAGAGAIAHTLSGHYNSIMSFAGNFFLVKATQELYDSGIPKVPDDVKKAVEQILEHKKLVKSEHDREKRRKKRDSGTQQSSTLPATEEQKEKPEIFQDDDKQKKYWCRYFDYSGGKENVIMQYDPSCVLYNIFDTSTLTPQLQLASTGSADQAQQKKQLTVKLNDFQAKTEDLEKKRLKRNDEFKRGGFYVLRIDKNRIPNVNSTFAIEITKPGKGKWTAERTYQPKITTVRIQAQLVGSPSDSVEFTFPDPLPSSRLIVKRVNNGAETQVDSPPDTQVTSSPDDDEEASYYFKSKKNGEIKLHIEHAWSFGSKTDTSAPVAQPTSTTPDKKEKFDLFTLDKEPLKNFSTNGTKTPKTSSDSEEKLYLFRNVSDFWKYKAGDHIDLYKSVKSKNVQKPNGRAKRDLTDATQDNNDGQSVEHKLGTFEIVSGAMVNLSSSSLRCVTKQQYEDKNFKANLRKEERLIDSSTDKKKDYCNKEGEPQTVLILLGYNGDV